MTTIIIIDSRNIYKKHDPTWYCQAEIKNGEIISLRPAYGRKSTKYYYEDLQEGLSELGRDFGMKFYEAIYNAAYKEKIKSPKSAVKEMRDKAIAQAEKRLAFTRKIYEGAKIELAKLKKRN